MRTTLAITALLVAGGAAAAAESSKLPQPNDIRSLSVYPTSLTIRGADNSPQLLVTAELNGGKHLDLTGGVEYRVADPKVAKVLPGGRVDPRGNGSTTITAAYGGKSVDVKLSASGIGENLPINFGNQIVPIFTKLGCNSGGCHGKLSGQNGFRLSLLGFEPELDYQTLVKEDRGRRIFPASPESSLLLLKSTGTVGHGGGRKLDPNSDEYKLVRRWIAAGAPYGNESDPYVTSISVEPQHRILDPQARQQLAVYAHYSDGAVEDITRRAQYESNDPEIATIDGAGLVQTLALTGEAAIMARYQGQVTVFRATVPRAGATPNYAFDAKSEIDKLVQKKWRELGLVPSPLTSDEDFLRRAYVDITGTLPAPKDIAAFLADGSADKRDKLIDRLLETPEYAYYFANKWSDILRVKRGNQQNRAYGTFAFHAWIRESIASDKPYDEFAREILGAVGDETRNPPTVWYKDFRDAEQFVDNLSQVFLGQRVACANCHHHPYEKWSQDDYWGLAAFYSRVGRKNVPVPGVANQNQQNQRVVIYTMANGNVTNKRTRRPAVMKPLDGEAVDTKSLGEVDPRHLLADWMVDPKNPFFAKAVANRYWAHFFGRGIVDPLDDMRVTNPPSNPELLDALAKDLVANKYSLKALIKTICKSRVYQLSSTPNEFNQHDKQAYARYYPKRLSAEVLYDAVCQVTGSPSSFNGLPADKFAPNRAIMLPDESFASYFLDVFGRPQRLSPCECERVSEANLAGTLHLLNSEEVNQKIARNGARADQLAKDKRPDAAKVQDLFLWTLGRKPNDKQMKFAMDNIAAHEKNKKEAYENILWALLNSKEFLFNR